MTENWIIHRKHDDHAVIDKDEKDGNGKRYYKQGGFAKQCCNYNTLGALKEMYKTLNKKYTGKIDQPHLRAKEEIIGDDTTWTPDDKAEVFDKKSVQRASRLMKKKLFNSLY